MINPNEIPAELSMIANLIATNPEASQTAPGVGDTTMIELFAHASGNHIIRAYLNVDPSAHPFTLGGVVNCEIGGDVETLEQGDLEKLMNSRFDEDSLTAAFSDFATGVLETKEGRKEHTWSWTLGNRSTTATSEIYKSVEGDFHYLSTEHSDRWGSGSYLGPVSPQAAKAA